MSLNVSLPQKPLLNKKVAILAANAVCESDMSEAMRALTSAGANLRIISTDQSIINCWRDGQWGINVPVDIALNSALGVDYDMLILPGGIRSLEKLMQTGHSRRFINSFMTLSKPICAMSDAEKLLEHIGADLSSANIFNLGDDDIKVMIQHFTNMPEDQKQAA